MRRCRVHRAVLVALVPLLLAEACASSGAPAGSSKVAAATPRADERPTFASDRLRRSAPRVAFRSARVRRRGHRAA